jgi:hypothetical protein
MKKTLSYLICTMLITCIISACNDRLDITRNYAFDLEVMPYVKKIVQGETTEIRCRIVKGGNYIEARYFIRYFQTDGKGELRLDDGRLLTPNDLFPLTDEVFYLYYTSQCTDQQNLDVYIEDMFGQTVKKNFSFQHGTGGEEQVNLKFSFSTLPVPSGILLYDTIEIRCQIVKEDPRNTATFSIRHFQPAGKGELIMGQTVLKPNDLYSLDSENFNLYYVSNSTERQIMDVYIVDSYGQTIQKTFAFENQPVPTEPETDYSFEFETLPVPKSVIEGRTVEIRCRIKRADSRNITLYQVRYFQPDGKGELRLDDGKQLTPNDLFPLTNDVFRLYYTSQCAVLQTIDVYIVDDYGRVVQKTFSFLSENTGNENKEGENSGDENGDNENGGGNESIDSGMDSDNSEESQ